MIPGTTTGRPAQGFGVSDLLHELYPFAIRTQPHGDGYVAYVDEGRGPALVFVHVGMWSFVWRDVINRLRTEFRCIAIDAPGSGLSSRDPRRPTVDDAAAAIKTVITSLELDEITLVFHDLGGPATLLAAGDWPERVRALVAVNTFGWRPSGLLFPTMLRVMGSAPMRWIDVASGWLPRMSSTRFGVGRHLDRRERRLFRAVMDRGGRRSFHHYIRSAQARRTDYDRIARTVEVLADRRVLTVFGERNDPGRFREKWQTRFDHATSIVVPGGYHFPMCDDPALVAGSIRTFLRQTTSGR